MSRRPPSDAFTRFTSTAPPSSSPPSASSANSSFSPNTTQSKSQSVSSPPSNPNETPAERVARLRAAHRANLASNQLSSVDRLIARGRTFADIAHRFTTYSLLAITGVSTVIAAYGIVSLVSHNRRQKRAWIERELERLAEAQRAFLRGEANPEQLHLLEQERAGEEIARKYAEDKKRRKEEGVWPRLKGTFGTFVGRGDMGVESPDRQKEVRELGMQVAAAEEETQRLQGQGQLRSAAIQAGPVAGTGLDEKGRPVPINKLERVTSSTQDTIKRDAKFSSPGPLDVLADNAVTTAQSTGQGWWGFITGGGNTSSTSTSSTSTSS